LGSFELLIKVYPSGKLTPILEKLALGDFVEVAGPRGLLTYQGNGAVVIKGRTETRTTVKELAMVAGGSGITPMFQVAQAVLSNPNDSTRVSLIFANVTEQDILLRQELETLQEQHGRLRIFFTLDKPPQDWRFGSGFVSAEMMQQHLPAADQDVMLLVCGPPPMVDSVKRLASSLGFASDRVYAF
jgi:cytochrome-b5 reductase